MRRLRAIGALVAATIALGVVAAPGAHAAPNVGFGLSPLRVDVESKPGARSSYEITVTNTDDRAATFTFSKVDIQGDNDDPEATPVLLGGKQASSISGYDWLDVPATTTIPAGASRKVTVVVNIPADATGGHYAALMVTGPTRAAGNLTVGSRIAVPFLMNAGGTPPPEVKVTDVKEFVGGGTKIVYENKGKTAVKPKPTIRYTDPITGKIVSTEQGSCTTALPGSTGVCTIPRGSSGGRAGAGSKSTLGGSGGYVELVTDEGTRARSELPTEWAGTWSSMLLPLAGLILAVLYFVFLRRRRRSNDEDEPTLGDGMAFS